VGIVDGAGMHGRVHDGAGARRWSAVREPAQ
jgi:hypothetical protein